MTRLITDAERIMRGESTASQLPGREAGPADAYRHILLAAELTRVYGADNAAWVLYLHEYDNSQGGDNGLDFWNNDIGMQIGAHVAANDGDWLDVVRLAREVVVKSFNGMPYDQISGHWNVHEADEGIRLAYERGNGPIGDDGNAMSAFDPPFDLYANAFNRGYRFLVADVEEISLDGGRLSVNPIALTSPQHWRKNPEVSGQEITVEQSAYPDDNWGEGSSFVYERIEDGFDDNNGAIDYYVSLHDEEPPVGYGGRVLGDGSNDERKSIEPRNIAPRLRDKKGRSQESSVGLIAESTSQRTISPSFTPRHSSATPEISEAPGPGHTLVIDEPSQPDWLLTVPGAAMSAGQREALMQMPAFSDEGDPLFGPAVWKYRDANAAGAARAVETGAVDGFGRPLKPVFAVTDGAPADADGKPMGQALGLVGQAVDKAAGAVGAEPAVKALQGAVNDLSDAQVKADTPRDGLQARPRIPKLAVDGDLGPKTREALRLALHQAGSRRLTEGIAQRMR